MSIGASKTREQIWISHDKLIKKTIIECGYWGGESPFEGGICQVSIRDIEGNIKGSDYLSPACSRITIGEGDSYVDTLVDRALRRMWKGEISRVELDSKITFILHLVNYVNPQNPYYNISSKSEAELSEHHKEKGSQLFKDGHIECALQRFSTAARYVIFADTKEYSELYCKVCNNIALCKLKLGKPEESITLCSKVISQYPDNIKAVVRRAESYLAIQEPELARQDLMRALQLNNNNLSAKKLLETTIKELAKQKTSSTLLAKKMLNL